MSASKAHVLFLMKQKTLGYKREVYLKKLSETRWFCRDSSIKATISTIEAVSVLWKRL